MHFEETTSGYQLSSKSSFAMDFVTDQYYPVARGVLNNRYEHANIQGQSEEW